MCGTASTRVIARVLTVCAVLVGLFVMHGLPAQACPAGTGMAAASAAGHRGEPARATMSVQGEMSTAFPAVHTATPEHGTACVFTPAPRGIDELLALLLAATVALVSPAWRPTVAGYRYPRSHRAPPGPGTELLTALCVSRT